MVPHKLNNTRHLISAEYMESFLKMLNNYFCDSYNDADTEIIQPDGLFSTCRTLMNDFFL